MSKPAYQFNTAGLFVGQTEADESPLEPGVFLLPARSTLTPPPAIPEGQAARWNGQDWSLINMPTPDAVDPVAKLQAFLSDNPDVAALLSSNNGGANV